MASLRRHLGPPIWATGDLEIMGFHYVQFGEVLAIAIALQQFSHKTA